MTAAQTTTNLPTLFELAVRGGPLMIPIAICSVAALGIAIERAASLRAKRLGDERLAGDVLRSLRAGDRAGALRVVASGATPLSRILKAGLDGPESARESRVEDVATSEVKALHARLRPLLLVYVVAPLLGLLGTVWGMIAAFATVAHAEGLGKPELLAAGVYQALVTTAAGLAVAIPVVLLHQGFRARVDRFARGVERTWDEVALALARGPEVATASMSAEPPAVVAAEVPRADP